MALTRTTLASAMLATDQFISVTSATGFAAKQLVKVDDEYMVVSPDYVSGTFIPVFRRGDQGSKVVAHNALAEVVTAAQAFNDMAAFGQWQDMQKGRWKPDIVWMSVSGAIAIPTRDTCVILNKAGVAAMTLAAPGKDQTGLILEVTSDTAQAHTVTATSLLSTGSANVSVATFAAQKGSGFGARAVDGLWNITWSQGITFS